MVKFAKINLIFVPGSPGFEGAFPFESHLGAQGEGGEFGHHVPDQFILQFFFLPLAAKILESTIKALSKTI
jgi:hypothetical protein